MWKTMRTKSSNISWMLLTTKHVVGTSFILYDKVHLFVIFLLNFKVLYMKLISMNPTSNYAVKFTNMSSARYIFVNGKSTKLCISISFMMCVQCK